MHEWVAEFTIIREEVLALDKDEKQKLYNSLKKVFYYFDIEEVKTAGINMVKYATEGMKEPFSSIPQNSFLLGNDFEKILEELHRFGRIFNRFARFNNQKLSSIHRKMVQVYFNQISRPTRTNYVNTLIIYYYFAQFFVLTMVCFFEQY